ncbi:MAG: ECF transporter S component [Oscillospiraceae bacterium]|nr:ECF transporter S component [Oscillospiraceae bacterium]
MHKKKLNTKRMVLLSMLSGILLVMSFTPLGYLNIGPLAISLNMIPVAIAAVALGPSGGAFLGATFGVTSCLQCVGIGGSSLMGTAMFEISPILTIIQRFVPRLMAGWLAGLSYQGLCRITGHGRASSITGFLAALLNTVLFTTALVLLFGNTEYLRQMIGGQNIIVFMCTFVGVNAVVEMLAATLAVGAVCKALEKTRLIGGK